VPIALLVGEQIAPPALVGLFVVVIGVALSSLGRDESGVQGNQGIGLAILSSFGYAGVFALFGFVLTPVLGGIIPVWVSRVTCVTIFTLAFLIMRRPFGPPRDRATWLAILGVGVLDTVGFTAYAIGTTGDSVAVSVLSSLFAAVTVLLAWIFLRERPRSIQWVGIAAIFAGLILVSAPG
jgi:drug/metabolite transporter (DMT)-like permease